MTSLSPDPSPLPSSLRQPTITGLPAPPHVTILAADRKPDVVTEYLRTTRSWGRAQDALPTAVSWALWIVLLGAGCVGGWLTAVRTGHAPGSGLVYALATLGHPGLLLILAGVCVVTLLGLAPFTRGLTRAGWPELTAMTVAGAAGGISLLGVVAVAVLAVMAAFLTVALLLAVVERS